MPKIKNDTIEVLTELYEASTAMTCGRLPSADMLELYKKVLIRCKQNTGKQEISNYKSDSANDHELLNAHQYTANAGTCELNYVN